MNFPLSVLDLAWVTQGHSAAETFEHSAALTQEVEKLGYTRYWLAEHHNMEGVASTATSVLIGYIASRTKSIRVGSGGIMLPNHAPLIVAEQFGTLATLYPDRIDLGLGRAPGTDALTAHALRRDQAAVMDFEGNIRELQRYFSEDNKNASVRAIPAEGANIPIWVLGSSIDSAYLAAAMGLPYAFAAHFAPAQLSEALRICRENFQPKNGSKPKTIVCVNVICADDDHSASILATSFKKLFLGIITGKRSKLAPPVDDPDFMDPLEEAALLQMTRYSFVGGPEKVQKELREFIRLTQADELMVSTPVYDPAARTKSYQLLRGLDL